MLFNYLNHSFCSCVITIYQRSMTSWNLVLTKIDFDRFLPFSVWIQSTTYGLLETPCINVYMSSRLRLCYIEISECKIAARKQKSLWFWFSNILCERKWVLQSQKPAFKRMIRLYCIWRCKIFMQSMSYHTLKINEMNWLRMCFKQTMAHWKWKIWLEWNMVRRLGKFSFCIFFGFSIRSNVSS